MGFKAKTIGWGMVLLLGICPWVAQADLLDLTTTGATVQSTAQTGGTFIVQQISPQSTGTGVIDPFVRINPGSPGNPPNEAGYNTAGIVVLDDVSGAWLHLLPLTEVPIVNLGGTNYRQFMLDINQNNGGTGNLLSLNQIQIFTGGPAPTTYGGAPCDSSQATCSAPPNITLAGLTNVFTMSASTDPNGPNQIKMDYSLNQGSGSGDMFLYVLDSVFTGGPYVTLFSQFGDPTGFWRQTDGFEEWAVLTGPTSVPDGGVTLMLLGGALVSLEALRRRFRA